MDRLLRVLPRGVSGYRADLLHYYHDRFLEIDSHHEGIVTKASSSRRRRRRRHHMKTDMA